MIDFQNAYYHSGIYAKNLRSFTAVVGCEFGRRVMYTNLPDINAGNIVEALANALPDHQFNQNAIAYLDKYYRGDQPILYRRKDVREEINNRVVENHAYELVESKTADLYGEPVQYVLKGTDDSRARMIAELNRQLESEDKPALDIERGRWASICGTSYYGVWDNRSPLDAYDETNFYLTVEHPARTFVVYFADTGKPAFSCQIKQDADGETFYRIYTDRYWFDIQNDEIIASGDNGNWAIPVIEYPNNERRLSDIEITITLTDEMNKMQSDRMNGIEQFVQALMLFKNCEISEDKFLEMVKLGAVTVKTTTNGYDADVRMLTSELDQTQSQVAKDDVYDNFLIVQGKPGRQENSGGDTGQAVVLRNGYYDEDKRAELRVPLFKKCERAMLRVVLNKIRVATDGRFDLRISDIEIKPKRSKLENMMVKAQVLQILHQIGIDDRIAIKTVNLFYDPEEVVAASAERMEEQFKSSIGASTSEADALANGSDNATSDVPSEGDK